MNFGQCILEKMFYFIMIHIYIYIYIYCILFSVCVCVCVCVCTYIYIYIYIHFCFWPHFSLAELKDLRLFLCTQKAYFSQILLTNLSKSVLVSTSPFPK